MPGYFLHNTNEFRQFDEESGLLYKQYNSNKYMYKYAHIFMRVGC